MARVKRSVNAQKKRREVLERASGYRGQRSRLYRKAKEQVTHSMVYAYADRRTRKGDFPPRLCLARYACNSCAGSNASPSLKRGAYRSVALMTWSHRASICHGASRRL